WGTMVNVDMNDGGENEIGGGRKGGREYQEQIVKDE
ncbi:hypothetical protein Tco_0110622, partial [Tanacetum coccineum]